MIEQSMSPETFQMLGEYIAAQSMCAVVEHEFRVHQPANKEASALLGRMNEGRMEMWKRLEAKLVTR